MPLKLKAPKLGGQTATVAAENDKNLNPQTVLAELKSAGRLAYDVSEQKDRERLAERLVAYRKTGHFGRSGTGDIANYVNEHELADGDFVLVQVTGPIQERFSNGRVAVQVPCELSEAVNSKGTYSAGQTFGKARFSLSSATDQEGAEIDWDAESLAELVEETVLLGRVSILPDLPSSIHKDENGEPLPVAIVRVIL